MGDPVRGEDQRASEARAAARTAVSTNAPAQARRVPAVVGAHRVLEDHHRHVGHRRDRSVVQYWLLSAVNSSGAVSPLMRASASRMPVTMPGSAARYSTCTVTFHCGTPSDSAASRICDGTSRSISSVVRTTTGSTISASAKRAGEAGEVPDARDHQRVDEQAQHDRRRRQQDVVDETDRLAEPACASRIRPGRCRPARRSACR